MSQSAYVFVYLPGDARPTVAGRFDWQTAVSPSVGEFVYAQSYLANGSAVPLDPIALPLREKIFATVASSGFFGVLRDATPDDWGRHLAARLFGAALQTDFDYLWMNTADRIGALAFGNAPDAPVRESPLLQWDQVLSLPLLEALQKIDREVPLNKTEEEAALAFGAGTSAGGARPKFTVIKDGHVWLAKLNRHNDRFNVVRIEAAMLDLAAASGITVPEHELAHAHDQDVLLVRRFDRVSTSRSILRHRMVSGGTVFQADEPVARYSYTGSYPRLARELSRWAITGDLDRHELFRRVAFNAVTSVTDDHERNHALVAEGPHFRLAPAFDLVPQPSNTRRRFLALNIGEFGALAVRRNLLSSVEAFQLTPAEANFIIDDVQRTVSNRWRETFAQRQVSRQDMQRIEGCFDTTFFESDPPDS